jgi:hypothetical protein
MKDKIEIILAQHDPVALIKMGAPLDEYSSEAQMIFDNLDESFSVEKIQHLVYDIFKKSFGSGDIYRVIEFEMIKIGKKATPDEHIDRIIGTIDNYRLIAEDIKKILPAP